MSKRGVGKKDNNKKKHNGLLKKKKDKKNEAKVKREARLKELNRQDNRQV